MSIFPEITKRPGYFVGIKDNPGDALTLKILKNDLVTVLHRSVVRSAADANHRGKKECNSSQMYKNHLPYWILRQFFWKNSHRKYRSRKTDNDVLNSAISKVDYANQHAGSRTWSKIHNVNVNDLSVQNLFFSLYDKI
jgi:hypothetical protein